MLAWLGYMKHGEPQERVFGLKMPPPNLKPDFEEQAKAFVDGLVDGALRQPVPAGRRGVTAASERAPSRARRHRCSTRAERHETDRVDDRDRPGTRITPRVGRTEVERWRVEPQRGRSRSRLGLFIALTIVLRVDAASTASRSAPPWLVPGIEIALLLALLAANPAA